MSFDVMINTISLALTVFLVFWASLFTELTIVPRLSALVFGILLIITLKSKGVFLRLLRRDFTLISRVLRFKWTLSKVTANDTVAKLFRDCVAKNPTKAMFLTKSRKYTYQEVEDFTNRVANYFMQQGYNEGDTIALVMENRPEFVFLWLGLSKIGVCTALVNTNLRLDSLVHCITIVNSKAVIVSATTISSVCDCIADIRSKSVSDFRVFSYDSCSVEDEKSIDVCRIDKEIMKFSSELPLLKGKQEDKIFYIFTSGTTGLPKGALIKHRRYIQLGLSATHILSLKCSDVYLHYLPFYHLAASVLGLSQTLFIGATGAVVQKFSASRFWSDCAEFNVTVVQYIGEICRYLLAQPQRPVDRQHSVRLMYGNGLRKEVWTDFKERFSIENICELYGSTEGTSNMANVDNTPGAVGFLPMIAPLLSKVIPIRIIKVDPYTRVPIRNVKGRCILCEPNEVGEIVGILRDDVLSKFDGYVDRDATDKKIYRNCFEEGDRVFASGDLVYKDENGYVYFSDRLGDTFRWKGENVSTFEVETVITKSINDGTIGCCVYAVHVPGTEGRAGMAAILSRTVDLQSLLENLKKRLPAYAIPLFVRLTQEENVTSTFKMTKVSYQKDAFDLSKCGDDPVYFLDAKNNAYVRMDDELQRKIELSQVNV